MTALKHLFLSCLLVTAAVAASPPPRDETAPAAPTNDLPRHFRLEASGFDNIVSNGFGKWGGAGLSLTWQGSNRVLVSGAVISERRPAMIEHMGTLRTVINWSKWFYTDSSISGGGSDDPAGFFPRIRYDLTGNVKLPWVPGLVFTGGLTRLYFGSPIGGSIGRTGVIYYWRRFVMQANVNFNNAQPGDHTSKSANAAVQYGEEGRYWVGVSGGGREAWQTLTLTPQDVEFTSYSASVFARKWLARNYGVAFSYDYILKRTAYRINGMGVKFFIDF
ncbi:MAG: YaiO family outer membrane beta-barrel protein [Acidobacteria bacterium]|nr:YaiO family outer membrane beta-barrel protein [Acidobacteriota bacterium]